MELVSRLEVDLGQVNIYTFLAVISYIIGMVV